MIKSIETTGRTEDDAIAAALSQLNLTRDDVSVEVLERAKSGFLGFGSSPAKVKVSWEEPDPEPVPPPKPPRAPEAKKPHQRPAEIRPQQEPKPVSGLATPTEADLAKVETFLAGLFERMGVEASAEAVINTEENVISVELSGEHVGALIGRRGETLDAIQHLTNYVINSGSEERTRVNIDAENYRAKRADTLTGLARKTAAKVVRYRRNQTLEPMNAYERHVIHTALQDFEGVTTYSTGTEPNRRVVIAYDAATAPRDTYASDRRDYRDDRRDDRRDRRPPRRSPSYGSSRPAGYQTPAAPEKPPVDKTVKEWS